MDTNSIVKPVKAVNEPKSLLSQMTLHFEYNKTIPEVRAALSAKDSSKK